MAYRLGRRIIALACIVAGSVAPVSAQLFWKAPDFRGAPIQGDEKDVLIPLPGATDAERDAGIVWTLRAGLNVAALQCQFANSLMTVYNYNGLLAHHSKELNTDYKALQGYFKRTAPKGAKPADISSALDQYTTRTYNSFSTLRAQYGFCQTAGSIGEDALMRPKGTLLDVARTRMREFRNSLIPTGDAITALGQPVIAAGSDVPGYPANCFNSKGALKKSCLKD